MTASNDQLILAVQEDDMEIATTALRSGADVNVSVWNIKSGLFRFIQSTEMFNLLIGAGLKVSHKTLVDAANEKSIKGLLDFGLPVDGEEGADGTLYTALMQHAGTGNLPLAKLLLNNGANPNAFGKRTRWTALHFAVNNAQDNRRPLDYRPHLEIIDLLLQHGANIDARADEGMTPLIRAAHNRQPNLTKHLLMAGAYIHAVDLRNRTAIDNARKAYLLNRTRADEALKRSGFKEWPLFTEQYQETLKILTDWAASHPLKIDPHTGEIVR